MLISASFICFVSVMCQYRSVFVTVVLLCSLRSGFFLLRIESRVSHMPFDTQLHSQFGLYHGRGWYMCLFTCAWGGGDTCTTVYF